MDNEHLEFNGYYAVVDDCDNVLFESEDYEKAFDFYDERFNENNELWLTREMESINKYDGLPELGFTQFEPVTVEI